MNDFISVPDYVTITKEGDPQFGLVGRVQHISNNGTATVLFYGKDRHDIPLPDLELYAKFGTRSYSKVATKALEWGLNRIEPEDYDSMMDFALSIGDFQWCRDILKSKAELPIKKVK